MTKPNLFALGLMANLALILSACALAPGRVGYIVHSPQGRPIVVETDAGPVRGVAAPEGRAFLGVPFAAPPVGRLRFAPPVPPAHWQAERDATRAGPICPQDTLPGNGRVSEDCLTLNVYAPHDADPAHPMPVMMWLYGGGFDSGANVTYDPSRLAERRGVVVVAPNYRLGAFGFMAHPALRGPGEGAYALLDQQAALGWIGRNIGRFGGDPANVTLFGESAGGWSVCYQLTAPAARGLFQRAIIQSGACGSPLSAISMADAEAGGSRMAATLGCGTTTDAAECLRRLPTAKLLKAKAARRGLLGDDAWSPAWGGDVLPKSPRLALEAGQFAVAPVIDGTNHDEGRIFLYTKRLKGRLFTQSSYEGILRDAFQADAPRVVTEYAAEARVSRGLAYSDVVTDSTFACPSLTLNALLKTRSPVYAYEFDDPRAATTLPRTPLAPSLKAYHSADIAYVFQTRWAAANPAVFDARQRALSDRIQAYWSTFAKTGRPDVGGVDPWPLDTGAGPLVLSPKVTGLRADFAAAHHCAFWNAIGY